MQHSENMRGTPMNVSLERQQKKVKEQRRKVGQQFLSQNTATSLNERNKSCRKNVTKQLCLSSSEKDTNINDQNLCANEEDDVERRSGKCFI
jgi:hypothetical protein